jgi:hypothetical protein
MGLFSFSEKYLAIFAVLGFQGMYVDHTPGYG